MWWGVPPGGRGGPRLCSTVAIETSITLRTVFGRPLRQTEAFVGSLLGMPGLDHLPVPDHGTLSRRSPSLDVAPEATRHRESIQLIVDSTGLQIAGEALWTAADRGKKHARGRRKLHVAVHGRGFIIARCVTGSRADDASSVPGLPIQVSNEIERFTADGAYDKTALYESPVERGRRLSCHRQVRPLSQRRTRAQHARETRQ